MGVYGYPISEEELERDRKNEMERLKNGEENEDTEAHAISMEDAASSEDTSSEEQHSKNSKGKRGDLLERAKDFVFLTKPALMNEAKSLLSEEDFRFMKDDFFWYATVSGASIVGAILIFVLSILLHGQMWLMLAAVLLFFGGSLVTNFWRGRYWYYLRRNVSSRKLRREAKDVLAEIVKMKDEGENPPVNRSDVLMFVLMAVLGLISIL